jgi:hypothetical protein
MKVAAFLPQQAPHIERGADLYETAPEAVRALLGVETLPSGAAWEPACGPGAIARVLRAHGHRVWATDLHNYHSSDQDQAGVDFLKQEGSAPCFIGSILTNPPFRLANEFAHRALVLCPRLFLLLRLQFLEGTGRTALLESGYLRRVHIFRNRLPRMHRAGWNGPRSTSSQAFAWFVWDRTNPGPTELRRISWRAEP